MSTHLRTIVAGVAAVHAPDPILAPAIELARSTGAELHFVHVYELPDPLLHAYAREGLLGPDFGSRYRDQLRECLEAEVSGLADDVPIQCHAVPGSASETLCATAEEVRADLIVVGATRSGKLLRTILGSTAERVVRSASLPVLLLRQPRIALSRVLLTTDLSEFSAAVHEHGLDLVEALAGTAPPSLRSLLVVWYEMAFPPPLRRDSLEEVAQQELDSFLQARRERAKGVEGRVRIGDPAKEISAEAAEWPADLLILGTHARRGGSRFFLGSVAESAVRSTTTNVLVLPPNAAAEPLDVSVPEQAAAVR
jgi:nucleotide-binding universal stress UspA family protein